MNGLIQLKRRKGILIFGNSIVYFYGTNLMVGSISKGFTPYIVDSETSFDPYAVCRIARKVGLNPKDTLKKIKVARAFNPYQTLEIIKTLPGSKNSIVFLYGPLTLLEDPDFSISEQEILYKDLLRLIGDTIRKGQWVIFLQDVFNKRIVRMVEGIQKMRMMSLIVKIKDNTQLRVIKNDLGIRALSSMEVKEWEEQFFHTPLFWRKNYTN